MSKYINIPEQSIADIKAAFDEALKKIKMSDGRINFTKTFGTVKRECTLYFTEVAYLKMTALVREFDSEIAWHGIAKRCEGEEDAYVVSDILVYPQEVAGATVTTDQQKYQTWLYNHDDEVFNNIRMQGHSHVNMGTSPSSVDLSLYERILDQLDDTMFYIFLIWNKKGDKTIKIYDMAKNILFETADITVKVLDGEIGMEKFLKEAKEMAQEKKHTTPTVVKGTSSSYSGYYGGYYGSYGGHSSTTSSTPSKTTAKTSAQTPEKSETTVTGKSKEKNSGGIKLSGKKKKKKSKGSATSKVSKWEDDYYSMFD